jgi:2-oxoglutarate/2-oxoacid ferredoxin oxidoreductase subunit beta
VPSEHDVTDELAAYKLADQPFPGHFGIFYKKTKPTKNAKEAEIVKSMKDKVGGLADWQILQKNFDRMK